MELENVRVRTYGEARDVIEDELREAAKEFEAAQEAYERFTEDGDKHIGNVEYDATRAQLLHEAEQAQAEWNGLQRARDALQRNMRL